jgi:hypothetical protein
VFHSPRFYSILASMASLTLALLSLLHFILHVYAFYESGLIPRDLWVLLEVFLLPAEGGSGVICRDFNLKVYAIIASVLGFISYTVLYYMVSLGLLTLAGFRYELLLLYVLGLIIPALNGLTGGSFQGLYYPVYTIPNVLLEAGFRSVLYCNISYRDGVIPGWLEWLILLQPTYIIANIILVLTLLKVYRLFRHRTLLAPLITATAPIAILALSLAIFLLALLISPFTRDGEFNLAYRVGLLAAFILIFHLLVAPVYGVLLWGSLAIAFLKLARGKPL